MKNKLKKLAKVGLVLYALNKCFLPVISFSCYNSDTINDPEIQASMETEKYVYNYDCNTDQETALNQLKLAHAITMKYLALGEPDYSSSNKDFLDKRIGDCSETSRFTYSNYIFLVKNVGKPELCDYVRLAAGSIHGFGHAWLEIKQDGKWVPYETTENDIPSDTEIHPSSIDELMPSEYVLRCAKDYNETHTHQLDKNGKTHHRINVLETVKRPGFLLLEWRNIFER